MAQPTFTLGFWNGAALWLRNMVAANLIANFYLTAWKLCAITLFLFCRTLCVSEEKRRRRKQSVMAAAQVHFTLSTARNGLHARQTLFGIGAHPLWRSGLMPRHDGLGLGHIIIVTLLSSSLATETELLIEVTETSWSLLTNELFYLFIYLPIHLLFTSNY